ncbi:MAG: hypothetical protein HQ509_09370, partial [Candidatus Marinimicrobia bacterium]|nr:hypothetical protein [Candidatus Neomarinimicrobiota bacterium]
MKIFNQILKIIFNKTWIIFCIFVFQFTFGTTFTVTSNSNSGANTVRQAIADASDGDNIIFNISAGNETIIVSSALSINDNLTIDGSNSLGSGTAITIEVSTPGSSNFPVIDMGAYQQLSVSYMTLRGGNISSSSGGAIQAGNCESLILDYVTIKDSKARFGGAIYYQGYNGSGNAILSITNCTIQDNQSSSHGAGIRIINSTACEVTIENTVFSNNTCTATSGNNYGGAIYTYDYATLNIDINKCTFTGNIAGGGGAGGTAIYFDGTLLKVNNSTFYNNSINSSAGYGALDLRGTTHEITNSTFFQNSCEYWGGAIASWGSTTITNCTIVENTAGLGQGNGLAVMSGTTTIKNTLIVNNSTDDFHKENSATLVDNGYNIVETGDVSNFYSAQSIIGEQTDLNLDASLADNEIANGTQTLALLVGSIAIDGGNDADNGTVTIPSSDQRGFTRNGTTDIGAFEYGGTNPYAITVTGSDLITTEAGETASFTVVLESEPTSDVTIGITSSDATEGIVDLSSLTFTSGNWSAAQTVTISGVNDNVDDGDIDYIITLEEASSSDGNYNGVDPTDVSATNTDDDTAGITVTGSDLTTTEVGSTASFTVVLDSEPTADVVIPVS